MTTADMIAAAPISDSAPAWPDAFSTRGDVAWAAAALDRYAMIKGVTISEIARVSRHGMDVFYARGEPIPLPT
jgi:hypothetical protein